MASTWHRYDAFFLRTGAFDVPAEGKSAFAQEMEDVAVMASECTDRSLVIARRISTHSRRIILIGDAQGDRISAHIHHDEMDTSADIHALYM